MCCMLLYVAQGIYSNTNANHQLEALPSRPTSMVSQNIDCLIWLNAKS